MSDNASKYDPDYCRDLIEHMASGCSYATFGATIAVRFKTMKAWEKTHPEWAQAVELGQLTLMYTWEKIIIGQAQGTIKGLPATTIFALKNYFPEKFKENMALQGSGNTIVVFDSGVPIKTVETTANPHKKNDIEDANFKQIEKVSDAVSDQVVPDFFINSDIPVKGKDIPIKSTKIEENNELTIDDI